MEDIIKDWGYIALFFYSFGGGFIGLVIAAVLSYAGDLNIYISAAVACVSNFLGDQFLFYMARSNKKYAKQVMAKYSRKIALAHLMIRKYGTSVVFIQKYIYGIKTLIPLVIGLTKYPYIKFSIYNVFASVIWAAVVAWIGFISGKYILSIADDFKYIGIGVAIALFVLVTYLIRKFDKQ